VSVSAHCFGPDELLSFLSYPALVLFSLIPSPA
jgi:hypothetical protein